MALQQRKGKGNKKKEVNTPNQNDDDDPKKKQKKRQEKPPARPKYKKKITGSQALLFVGAVLGLAGLVLYQFYKTYGATMFFGQGWKGKFYI